MMYANASKGCFAPIAIRRQMEPRDTLKIYVPSRNVHSGTARLFFHSEKYGWSAGCDKSPDGKGTLQFARGIEVGHIFQLGNKYSKAMGMTVLDENGKATTPMMGCYGIGVSRIIGAAIEQHHDDNGILWPDAMAPFQVCIVGIRANKSYRVKEHCDKLYDELTAAGFDVLYDDRAERPGVMFADMDLIGIPHRFVVGEKGLDAGEIEYKYRRAEAAEGVAVGGEVEFLQGK